VALSHQSRAPAVDLKPADLTAMLRVNLFGALFVMQEAVCAMRQQDDGCLVNIGSLAGRRGLSPLGGYCASKFALVGLTEALRTELHDTNIHVALVMPGVTDTPMTEGVARDEQLGQLWPVAFNMPPSWVVFVAARFRLVEVSVPPGAATIEKLGALMPGVTDSFIHWGTIATQWLAELLGGPAE
jgi:NAD(P)-dependent dehydrogenase (short-subunit alcohol dehydrogenase family)